MLKFIRKGVFGCGTAKKAIKQQGSIYQESKANEL